MSGFLWVRRTIYRFCLFPLSQRPRSWNYEPLHHNLSYSATFGREYGRFRSSRYSSTSHTEIELSRLQFVVVSFFTANNLNSNWLGQNSSTRWHAGNRWVWQGNSLTHNRLKRQASFSTVRAMQYVNESQTPLLYSGMESLILYDRLVEILATTTAALHHVSCSYQYWFGIAS